jgi:ribosomal protein S18 acetylase RimI-like enzyme
MRSYRRAHKRQRTKTRRRKQRGGAVCPPVEAIQIGWYDPLPPWSIEPINATIKKEFIEPQPDDLAHAASCGVLAIHNGPSPYIAGFLIVRKRDKINPECQYIEWVLVNPECRRKGLARAMLKLAIEKNHPCIKLNVQADSNTQKSYLAAGFVNTGAYKMLAGPYGIPARMDEMILKRPVPLSQNPQNPVQMMASASLPPTPQ